MPFLLALPAELRQSILVLLLPDSNVLFKPWPRSILNLLHISSRIRQDMGVLISAWSPLHYIPHPRRLSKFRAQRVKVDDCICAPKIERICIDLFYESDLGRILETCFCRGSDFYSHPEIIAGWAKVIPHLPKNVEEVFVDVTPAPLAKRNHRFILYNFVRDKRPAKNFLSTHVQDVGALLRAINEYYEGQMPIALTGTLSTKSRFFVQGLQLASGLDFDFIGTWVTPEDAPFKKITITVDSLASKKNANNHLSKPLKDVKWSSETTWAYAKVADAGEEEGAVKDLLAYAEFKADEGRNTLIMEPNTTLRRALQHNIARDMGFTSNSEGDGTDRHVVVRKVSEDVNTLTSINKL